MEFGPEGSDFRLGEHACVQERKQDAEHSVVTRWHRVVAHRVCPVPASLMIGMSKQYGSCRGSNLAGDAEACRDEDILDARVANS